MAPAISQGRGMSPQAVDTQNQRAKLPSTRNHGLSIGDDRTHFQPSAQMWIGSRNTLMPKICSSRSAHFAPKRPSRLCVCVAAVAVSQEGSPGEYETRLRETAK